MNDWHKVMKHSTFRLLDHSNQTTFHQKDYTALTSFAIDDALTLSISNQQSPPTMRLWVHEDTVVLGIPDSRLPHIEAGIQLLADSGYKAIIRNSGGLAVALDQGVLNISLILPDIKKVSIHDGYEAMFSFIQYMLRDLTNEIKAYEIVGSYCPGDYDLSIRGVKFAGISQRRIRDGAAIQIYLDVEGDSQGKANLIQEFYDVSLRGETTKFIYPDVNPHVMGSLSELLGIKLTMEDMKKRVYQTVGELSNQIISPPFSEAEWTSFQTRLKQMEKRNEKIAAWQ
ncbi:MAG TPA: lipoate--protein ligase family protein [Virgibacillus sp.]|nr:lipoate--protein ligase family protein [Virgibacillus sp.]